MKVKTYNDRGNLPAMWEYVSKGKGKSKVVPALFFN
jgi:hypothetical protein